MKPFKDLIIGDIVYKVDQGYKSAEGPQVTEVKVHAINTEGDRFQVNKYPGYSNYTYLINIPIKEANLNILRTANEFITTDINLVKLGMRETGMILINQYLQTIEQYKKKIEDVRKLYFEYLNYKE